MSILIFYMMKLHSKSGTIEILVKYITLSAT